MQSQEIVSVFFSEAQQRLHYVDKGKAVEGGDWVFVADITRNSAFDFAEWLDFKTKSEKIPKHRIVEKLEFFLLNK